MPIDDAWVQSRPVLLVHEVTNVHDAHLNKLSAAMDRDVCLSDSSSLSIPFWNMRTAASEEARRRIERGEPGSLCPKGFDVFNTEFTKLLISHASRAYHKRKLQNLLMERGPSAKEPHVVQEKVLARPCICHDLGDAALKNCIDPDATGAVSCGPNIVGFWKIATLKEMARHIRGRVSLLTSSDRPHRFIGEIKLYVDCLRKKLEGFSMGLFTLLSG